MSLQPLQQQIKRRRINPPKYDISFVGRRTRVSEFGAYGPTVDMISEEEGNEVFVTKDSTFKITPAEAAAELLIRRQRRGSLVEFNKKVFATIDPATKYLHNWHIDLICEYLEACTKKDIKRLIINIPPRHLKSILVTVGWPAWMLGRNPSEQIVASSYAGSLAIKHSVDCRTVLQALWYKNTFPAVQLTDDMNMKSEFVTTKRGHRIATSVGGAATGRGGNILIVDDPIDPKKAMSEIERKTANTWYDQTFSTRLNNEDSGCIVLVMQRLHMDDLTGHVLELGNWEHLKIPYEAPTDKIYDFGRIRKERKAGDLLQKERMDKEKVERRKKELGSYGWSGQFQQEPAPVGGGMIKLAWFGRYNTPPEDFDKVVHSWDTAQKENELNDYSVDTIWGIKDSKYYLLYVYRDKLRYPRLRTATKNLNSKMPADVLLIEDKSSGTSLIQDLREDTNLPVIAILPCNDKVTRMDTCSPLIEAGNVFIPHDAPWLIDYEIELSNFPNVKNDDQADSTSQFLNWIKRNLVERKLRWI